MYFEEARIFKQSKFITTFFYVGIMFVTEKEFISQQTTDYRFGDWLSVINLAPNGMFSAR